MALLAIIRVSPNFYVWRRCFSVNFVSICRLEGYGKHPFQSRIDTICKVVIIHTIGKIGKSPRDGGERRVHEGYEHGVFGILKGRAKQTVGFWRGKSRKISVRILLVGDRNGGSVSFAGPPPFRGSSKGWTYP